MPEHAVRPLPRGNSHFRRRIDTVQQNTLAATGRVVILGWLEEPMPANDTGPNVLRTLSLTIRSIFGPTQSLAKVLSEG